MFAHESIVVKHFETICSVDQGTAVNPKISINEELMINTILSRDNADELVKTMLRKYAGESVENARALICMVSDIADKALALVKEESRANREAAFWLIVQRGIRKKPDGTFFSCMVPVCKAIFPQGKCEDGRCDAEKKYWALFLEQFQNEKVFSWEQDKTWADNNGYTEYLRLVEKNLGKIEPA